MMNIIFAKALLIEADKYISLSDMARKLKTSRRRLAAYFKLLNLTAADIFGEERGRPPEFKPVLGTSASALPRGRYDQTIR